MPHTSSVSSNIEQRSERFLIEVPLPGLIRNPHGPAFSPHLASISAKLGVALPRYHGAHRIGSAERLLAHCAYQQITSVYDHSAIGDVRATARDVRLLLGRP